MKVTLAINAIKSIETTSKTCKIKGYKKPLQTSLYYTSISLKNGGEITYPFIQETSAEYFTNLVKNTLKIFTSVFGGESKALSLIAGENKIVFLDGDIKVCATSYLAQKEMEMEKFA